MSIDINTKVLFLIWDSCTFQNFTPYSKFLMIFTRSWLFNVFFTWTLWYITNRNIEVNQHFDEDLAKIPEFEFIIFNNFVNGFNREGT